MSENYKLTIMKELSIEEKAKRYDEAIKRASNLHKDAVEMENSMTTKTCEIIFPELKESDEKVREDIISLINEFWERIGSINPEYSSRSRMIAWLEKQRETFTKKDVDDAYLKGVCDTKQELEKQGKRLDADKMIEWLDMRLPR